MKKICIVLSLLAIVSCATLIAFPSREPARASDGSYRAVFVADYDTGTVIREENADAKYPIASMVKIMTLAITFDEIEKGRLSFDENVTVSEYASGMGGSQMFLDANKEYPVTDLIKGVVVCSANDAATALGERISGSIDAFVAKMNSFAQEIGMRNTVFCNATGLPNSGEQYSTARDVTTMMRRVLSHPKYYEYSTIWMEDYVHPDGRITEMVNTNKLVRFMPECDAGKTGFTNEAGFCLSASAKRGETRVVATLLGGSDSKSRFRTVSELLKNGLSMYETEVILRKNEPILCQNPAIKNARSSSFNVYTDNDLRYFHKRGEQTDLKYDVTLYENLKAPIPCDTEIGEIYLKRGDDILATAKLYTQNDVEKMNFGDYLKRILQNQIIRK